MQKAKLIELYKTDCKDCQAVKPVIAKLEKLGFVFEKYNIENGKGKQIWDEFAAEIDENSQKLGYEPGYIYTPAFINSKTRKVLAYSDDHPTKEELIKLAVEN